MKTLRYIILVFLWSSHDRYMCLADHAFTQYHWVNQWTFSRDKSIQQTVRGPMMDLSRPGLTPPHAPPITQYTLCAVCKQPNLQ